MTKLLETFDWTYIQARPWPQMPLKVKMEVRVGVKYFYEPDHLQSFMIGEQLPEIPGREPLVRLYVGLPALSNMPSFEECQQIEKQLTPYLTNRYKDRDKLCVAMTVFHQTSPKDGRSLAYMMIPSALWDLLAAPMALEYS